jgi:hypothetical protein
MARKNGKNGKNVTNDKNAIAGVWQDHTARSGRHFEAAVVFLLVVLLLPL